jgi:transcriptional regulator with XRE-family HTH domain
MSEPRHLLKARRDELGLSQAQAAGLIGCTERSYGRVERGESTPRRGATRQRYAQALQLSPEKLAVALGGERPTNGKSAIPGFLTLFVQLEQSALSIRQYEPTVLPGLLQTRAYATAIVSTERSDADVEELVQLRLDRQAILDDPDPIHLTTVVDEVALRRVAGSPAVMAEQLDRLAQLAQRPNIDVHVLPIAAGAHGVGFGAFLLLSFGDRSVAYSENRVQGTYVEGDEGVAEHDHVFEHLRSVALDPTASVEFIRNVRSDLL